MIIVFYTEHKMIIDTEQLVEAPGYTGTQPVEVQRAYLREFKLALDASGSYVSAKERADQLLEEFNRQMDNGETAERHIVLEACVAELDQAKAVELIPQDVLAKIKETDPHPFFAVYEIGKDGTSTGYSSTVGGGLKKWWTHSSIKELAEKAAKSAAKLFKGHGQDGDDRPSFGQIVHGYYKRAANSVRAFAVAHITDEATKEDIRSGKLDICSIEADVLFKRAKGAVDWCVAGVQKLTGLALASSQTDNPGFAGAGLVGTIQELENRPMAEDRTITKIELLAEIERRGMKPTDIFTRQDILGLDFVGDHVKAETETAVKAAEAAKDSEITKLNERFEPLRKAQTEKKIEEKVKSSVHLTDANEKKINYMLERAKAAGIDIDSLSAEELQVKIDSCIRSEIETAEKYGIKFEQTASDNSDDMAGDSDNPEPPAPAMKASGKGGIDYTDPAQNDLIP